MAIRVIVGDVSVHGYCRFLVISKCSATRTNGSFLGQIGSSRKKSTLVQRRALRMYCLVKIILTKQNMRNALEIFFFLLLYRILQLHFAFLIKRRIAGGKTDFLCYFPNTSKTTYDNDMNF